MSRVKASLKILCGLSTRIQRASNFLGFASGVLLFAMAIITTREVIMRYVFNRPSVWSMEACIFMLVLVTYVGSSHTQLERGHIRVDIIYTFLSKLKGQILDVFSLGICLFYISLVAWASWREVLRMHALDIRTDTILATPIYPFHLADWLGICMLGLIVLVQIGQDILVINNTYAERTHASRMPEV